MASRLRIALLASVSSFSLLSGCTSPTQTDAANHDATDATDGGTDAPPGVCRTDADCDDHVFCNGAERCMPGASIRGCILSPTGGPCAAPLVCNEATDQCMLNCPAGEPDADADGHRSAACGGDDCDDNDPNRFPGNPEVCAYMPVGTGAAHRPGGDHDEDCDPFTIQNATTHDGDHDGDGYVDVNCSNTDVTGTVRRGDDCSDADRLSGTVHSMTSTANAGDVHPMQTEACNGIDDNCNGTADEGLLVELHLDNDNDSWGQATVADTACSLPSGYADRGGDCADDNPAIHPLTAELCNGLDDDCNGTVDDNTEAICTTLLGNHGPARCFASGTGAVCRPIDCAMGFSDCDGNPANGCESDNCNDSLQCNHCGGSCPCSGGGCIGLNPSLSFLSTVAIDDGMGGTGAGVAGAMVTALSGCHRESATTDGMGEFTLSQTVTSSRLYRIDATGYRPHVAVDSYDLLPSSVVNSWFADADAPMEDTRRGIVVLEVRNSLSVDYVINAPGGPRQFVEGGDVQPAGVGGDNRISVWFNVAPGPVTLSPVIPVGCGASCRPVSTWVLPGGVTRVVIDGCGLACA